METSWMKYASVIEEELSAASLAKASRAGPGTEHTAQTESCLPRWKLLLSQVQALCRAQCLLPETCCRPGLADTSRASSATARPAPQRPRSRARSPASASRTPPPRRHGNQGGANPQPRPAPPLAQPGLNMEETANPEVARRPRAGR